MSGVVAFTGGLVVLEDGVLEDGCVVVEEGVIASAGPGAAPAGAEEIDLGGRTLLPGLIDLHSDAIEREIEPRPGVYQPVGFTIGQIDLRFAAAGVTTAYHALAFAGPEQGLRNTGRSAELARALHGFSGRGLVEHRVHCRYELTEPDAVGEVERLIDDGVCGMVSLMDHTPGQGQYKEVDGLVEFFTGVFGYSAQEVERLIERKLENASGIWDRVRRLARHASAAGAPVCSHDDDDAARVKTLVELGATISEFPMSKEAARAARAAGLHVIAGSPNAFRGGSHGSGLSARELVSEGLADCLCSDYAPSTMIPGVFRLTEEAGVPLHSAVATATANPAAAAGLVDRGRIAAGLRADLIEVDRLEGMPVVAATWVGGRRVLQADRAGAARVSRV